MSISRSNPTFAWKYQLTSYASVCEDAVSIKNDVAGGETWIIGGGAYNADDKVIQHNGCGTVVSSESSPTDHSTSPVHY